MLQLYILGNLPDAIAGAMAVEFPSAVTEKPPLLAGNLLPDRSHHPPQQWGGLSFPSNHSQNSTPDCVIDQRARFFLALLSLPRQARKGIG